MTTARFSLVESNDSRMPTYIALSNTHQYTSAFESRAIQSRGIERLSNADVYWWVFDNAEDVTKKLSTRSASTGRLGVVFQNEVYLEKRSDASRRAMVHFGVVYGVDQVCLYIVPRPDS